MKQLISAAASAAPPNIKSSNDIRWYLRALPGMGPSVREGATAVIIDGIMYTFGGMGGSGGSGDGGRSNALLRAPIKQYGKWETVVAKGTPPPPRSGHTASVVAGEMWVYGGEGAYNGLNKRDIFGDLRAYNPRSNTWRNLEVIGGPPYNLLPPARRGHTATLVKTVTVNRLVVFGGRGLDRVFGQDVFFNDLQVLDVPSMMWMEQQTEGPVPSPRSGHTATFVPKNETVFFIGGLSSRIVATRRCPRSNNKKPLPQFVRSSHMPRTHTSTTKLDSAIKAKRSEPAARLVSPTAAAGGGDGVVGGGPATDDNPVFASDDVYSLDTRLWRWTKTKPVGTGPGRVYGHGAAAHPDPRVPDVFVFGGRKPKRSDSRMARLFVLHTEDMRWSSPKAGGPPPSPRYGHVMAQGDECIIIFGGSSFDSYCDSNLSQLLLPVHEEALPPPPPPDKQPLMRLRSTAVVRGQTVLAAGPENHQAVFRDVTPADVALGPQPDLHRFGGSIPLEPPSSILRGAGGFGGLDSPSDLNRSSHGTYMGPTTFGSSARFEPLTGGASRQHPRPHPCPRPCACCPYRGSGAAAVRGGDGAAA